MHARLRSSISAALLLGLAACGDAASDGPTSDAGPDAASAAGADAGGPTGDAGGRADGGAPGDAAAATLPFLPSNVPASALAAGAPGDMTFSGTNCGGGSAASIDTDTGTISQCGRIKPGTSFRYEKVAQGDGSMVALFVTRTFRIDPTLTVDVRGQLPLVVVALDKIEILGKLDAAATDAKGYAGGFAARPNMKGTGNGPGAGTGAGNGGGGGGSHCGLGGKGGAGNAAGAKYGAAELVPLLGGSSGGNGGLWEAGAGGGAIQLVAGVSLSVTATGAVNVGGAGGMQNGAGGGSGGALLLEAPTVTIAGAVGANGGGGGSGVEDAHGADATATDEPAKGGSDGKMEAPGGDGAAGATVNGAEGKPNARFANGDFSGGGGGGVGYVRINTRTGAAAVTGKISPALTTPCATQGMLR
jgi:hypothetical protein